MGSPSHQWEDDLDTKQLALLPSQQQQQQQQQQQTSVFSVEKINYNPLVSGMMLVNIV